MITRGVVAFLATLGCLIVQAAGQVTSGEILGVIRDPSDAMVIEASVRSTYDRPHCFAMNGVLEIPFMSNTDGAWRHWLGGWQISGFPTLQSGGPFTPLNGADPGFRLTGISGQVGNAIRPNLNSTLDLSRMSLEEIIGARTLFPGQFK